MTISNFSKKKSFKSNKAFWTTTFNQRESGWKWLTFSINFLRMYISSTLGECLACLNWESVCCWKRINDHLQSIFHLYKPHHHRMIFIWCLLELESYELNLRWYLNKLKKLYHVNLHWTGTRPCCPPTSPCQSAAKD